MHIIQTIAEANGSHPTIMPYSENRPPEGWLYITPGIDTSAMHTHQGFVDLVIDNGVVTAITGNDAAYQAYLDSLPKPEPPAPDDLTMTQLAVAELAQAVEANNTANQLAIAELAETLIGGKANG